MPWKLFTREYSSINKRTQKSTRRRRRRRSD